LPFTGYVSRASEEEGKLDVDVNTPLSEDDVDEEDDYENIKKYIQKSKSNNSNNSESSKSPIK
jgi:hypothetical protein